MNVTRHDPRPLDRSSAPYVRPLVRLGAAGPHERGSPQRLAVADTGEVLIGRALGSSSERVERWGPAGRWDRCERVDTKAQRTPAGRVASSRLPEASGGGVSASGRVVTCQVRIYGETEESSHVSDIWLGGASAGLEIPGEGETLRTLALAADGSLLAAGYGTETPPRGCLKVWAVARAGGSAPAPRLLHKLAADERVDQVAFSPDGAALAAVCIGGGSRAQNERLTLYDPRRGSVRRRVAPHPWGIRCAFSPAAGALLATGGSDGELRLFTADAAEQLASFEVHPEPVSELAFAPDGSFVASLDSLGGAWISGVELDPLEAVGRELARR